MRNTKQQSALYAISTALYRRAKRARRVLASNFSRGEEASAIAGSQRNSPPGS
jgi:hypothetical protein